MKIEKCRYYNDAQTACTLMVDDLAGVAVTNDGVLTPSADWGYGLNSKDSLWRYFEKNILEKHPEVKGSVFYATQSHAVQDKHAGYKILTRDIDEEFKAFIRHVLPSFEMAFHGTTHGKYINSNTPELRDNFKHEFEYVTPEDIPALSKEINKAEEMLGVKFIGGKYCGYKQNEQADRVIEKLGFKWWASSARMINKKHSENNHFYWGDKEKVLEFPTNVAGNLFGRRLKNKPLSYPWLRLLRAPFMDYKREKYLQYLYENGLIISIQEHFQNQRTDGKRQTPNVYDDIDSLNHIYGILRGADIWHATCSEIAHYLESYDHSDIIEHDEKTFEIKYHGRWEDMLLSVKSDKSRFLHTKSEKEINGVYKNGVWVFNDIQSGKYVQAC